MTHNTRPRFNWVLRITMAAKEDSFPWMWQEATWHRALQQLAIQHLPRRHQCREALRMTIL
jgi:hypothetical protein